MALTTREIPTKSVTTHLSLSKILLDLPYLNFKTIYDDIIHLHFDKKTESKFGVKFGQLIKTSEGEAIILGQYLNLSGIYALSKQGLEYLNEPRGNGFSKSSFTPIENLALTPEEIFDRICTISDYKDFLSRKEKNENKINLQLQEKRKSISEDELQKKSAISIQKIFRGNQIRKKYQPIQHKIKSYRKSFLRFGFLEYEHALLTCAQTRSRKEEKNNNTDKFNPTIISLKLWYLTDPNKEYLDYITLIKKGPWPLRERFIVVSGHWMTGDIHITQNGQASLLIIDSLGQKSEFFPAELIQIFAEAFPKGEIYFSAEKRQHAYSACGAFALDDLMHLFTVENYLDKKYEKTGLFGYLSDHVVEIVSDNNINIRMAYLPLAINRTMQSVTGLKNIDCKRKTEEYSLNVNKKGEKFLESAEKSFEGTGNASKNIRLFNKLKKMGEYNYHYLRLRKDNLDYVENVEMQQFSFEGFKNKMLSRKGQEIFSFFNTAYSEGKQETQQSKKAKIQ